MSHLGFFCVPMPRHISTFLAAGLALKRRGHRITFFNISDNKSRIQGAEMGFERREPEHLPPNQIGELIRKMGDSKGLAALRIERRLDLLRYDDILVHGPAAIKRAGIDAMIVDQAEACTGTVAEVLGLPWATLCSGLCLNSEANVPPFFTSWPYRTDHASRVRNRLGYSAASFGSLTIRKLVNRHRRRMKLRPLGRLDDTFSPFAQICQQNAEFDYPRTALPSTFHYVGPLRRPADQDFGFPWDRLNRGPLIYASLGTLVNQNARLYDVILEAFAGLTAEGVPAQLVLSLGGGKVVLSRQCPASVIVVSYAPQRELLKRASLTISHAGMNTTLESLAEGVPIVAIPIAFEQPAIAARIRWTRCGEFASPSSVDAPRLRQLIRKVLEDPAYRESAQRMKTAIASTRGEEHAADIVETMLETRRPVHRAN